jgi:hypothetical protein
MSAEAKGLSNLELETCAIFFGYCVAPNRNYSTPYLTPFYAKVSLGITSEDFLEGIECGFVLVSFPWHNDLNRSKYRRVALQRLLWL